MPTCKVNNRQPTTVYRRSDMVGRVAGGGELVQIADLGQLQEVAIRLESIPSVYLSICPFIIILSPP